MTAEALVVLPAGIPWLLAAALALFDGRRPVVGWIAVAGLGGSLAAAILLTIRTLREGPVQMVAGGWPAEVGIALRADVLGATFAAVSAGVVLVSLVYEVLIGVRSRTFPVLVLFLSAGLSGLFVTGDVFSFYVFFEVSMTAAYVLVGYREQDYQVRAAFIFAVVNLLGSVLFLIGAAALYHVTGSLNMEVVAGRIGQVAPGSSISVATVIFVAFFLKLGLFPFHFWLPAVYVGSHAPVAAILSGALANIGSYGVLRFGADILPDSLRFASAVVMVLGVASIIYGALQAVSRQDTSEVMAYSAIGQVGYILVALAIGGPVGYAAAVIYAVANAMNKALVFLSSGLRGALAGVAFAVGAFSIAGVPPAVGFVGKLALFKASIESSPGGLAGSATLVTLIFLGGALSFLYSFQVYQRAFLAPSERRQGRPSTGAVRVWAVFLTAIVLLAGLWPEPLLLLGEGAAAGLTGEPAGGVAAGGGG